MFQPAALQMFHVEHFTQRQANLLPGRRMPAYKAVSYTHLDVYKRQALADALAAVESGYTLDAAGVCVDDALNALYALTGESATEDVIEEVFAKFCVGK